MGLNLVGAASGAQKVVRQQEMDLQEMLARAFAQRQAEAQMELQRRAAERADAGQAQQADQFAQTFGLQQQNFEADEAARKVAQERQGRLDDRQATADRQVENQRGVRRMIGDFLVRRGGQPLDPTSRQTLQGMAVQEDVDLPASVTEDPEQQFKDYERQKQIDARYRQPTQGREPNYLTLVNPDGSQQRRVVDGPESNALLGQGWKVYDAVTSRQSGQAAGAQEARQSLANTALATVRQLKTMGGQSGAVGAGFQKAIPFLDGPLPGTAAGNYTRVFNTLKAQLTLPELQKLRGLGAMSDREFKTLSEGATILDLGLSEDVYVPALEALEKTLMEMAGEVPAAGGAPPLPGGPGPVKWGRDAQGRPVRVP
jgi:hypothetical protein